MIILKKEEPIETNELLHQREINVDIVGLDSSKGIAINRYIFMPKCQSYKNNIFEIEQITEFICMSLNEEIYSFYSWSETPKSSKIYGIMLEKKINRQGYRILKRNNHYCAVTKNNKLNCWSPIDIHVKEILVFTNLSVDVIFNCFGNDDTLFMAEYKFIPSKNNIECFQKKYISIMYKIKDDFGGVGVVLITKQVINIKDLEKKLAIKVLQ